MLTQRPWVRIPLKSRIFFKLICNSLNCWLPLRTSIFIWICISAVHVNSLKSNILQTFKIWNYGVNLTNKDIQQNAKKYSTHTVFEQSFLRILYHVLPTGICSGQLTSCIRRLAERRVPPLATCLGGYNQLSNEDPYIGSRPICCVHLTREWNETRSEDDDCLNCWLPLRRSYLHLRNCFSTVQIIFIPCLMKIFLVHSCISSLQF